MTVEAPTSQAPANTLAILQAADCATTIAFMAQPHTFERNPIARALGANRSLPLCLAESAVINIGFRHFDKTKGQWATKAYGAIEVFAVGNNARVLLRLNTK